MNCFCEFAIEIEYRLHFKVELLKSFSGDKTKLGNAEKFLMELTSVTRLVQQPGVWLKKRGSCTPSLYCNN